MIGIHHKTGSFSDKWIEYCKKNQIAFKLVDCYSSDILEQLSETDGLMWHWAHWDYRDQLFARQLIKSIEISGKKVFPNYNTCWHFDDKVGQKYLLEAIGAPLVKSYVFFEFEKALDWARQAEYPKVFKLRRGAGAENVRLIKNFSEARQILLQAFSSGFKTKSRTHFLKERLWQFRRDKTFLSFLNLSKGIARLFIPTQAEKQQPVEKNYAYFQDFVPECDHDIRIVVIGEKAFAIKRFVRNGDFRASGSGKFAYEQDCIPLECVEMSFELNKKLRAQCLAYDFVVKEKKPLLIEVSYGFSSEGYLQCPGYWDSSLNWHDGEFVPEFFMIEDFLGINNG